MSASKTWDDRFAELLERIMATAVSNSDPKPLQEELAQLMNEAPATKRKALQKK